MALAVVYLVTLRPGAAPRVDLHVDFKERVNAVYHLACLAGSIACTKDVFERFWKERLVWTEADQAALDLWQQTMTMVTNAAPARPSAPLLPNTPRFHPTQAARTAVIVAAIEAASTRDLRRRSHDVLNADSAAQVKRAVDHFEQRIRSWLGTTASRARTYLLAGRDTADIIDAITTLAGMETLPSDGLLFSLD